MPKPESKIPVKKRKRTGGPLDYAPKFAVKHAGKAVAIPDGEIDMYRLYDAETGKNHGIGTACNVQDWIVSHHIALLRQLSAIMCAREKNKAKAHLDGRHVAIIQHSWVIERRNEPDGSRVLYLMDPDGEVISKGVLADMMVPMIDAFIQDAEYKIKLLMTDLFPTK